MKKVLWVCALALAGAVLVGPVTPALAGPGWEVVKGEAFKKGFVHEFYLEGNAIPTQERNTTMVQLDGKRLVFSLLDTSGYGADIQAKYVGMAIVEKPVSLGGVSLAVGAYGLGLDKGEGDAAGTFHVYDVAGQEVGSGPAPHDAALAQPVPLQVVTGEATKLYLGRYAVEIK
jgi:hypothetical protein